MPMNKLYFGDNLDMLREKIKDESVDLVYLDPPFKSNANYNVLFKPGGVVSEAQAEAFRDTWEWGPARDAYDDVMKLNGDVALVLSGLRRWLGESAMMAYLAMMAIRLLELRRVLKSKSSLPNSRCDRSSSWRRQLWTIRVSQACPQKRCVPRSCLSGSPRVWRPSLARHSSGGRCPDHRYRPCSRWWNDYYGDQGFRTLLYSGGGGQALSG